MKHCKQLLRLDIEVLEKAKTSIKESIVNMAENQAYKLKVGNEKLCYCPGRNEKCLRCEEIDFGLLCVDCAPLAKEKRKCVTTDCKTKKMINEGLRNIVWPILVIVCRDCVEHLIENKTKKFCEGCFPVLEIYDEAKKEFLKAKNKMSMFFLEKIDAARKKRIEDEKSFDNEIRVSKKYIMTIREHKKRKRCNKDECVLCSQKEEDVQRELKKIKKRKIEEEKVSQFNFDAYERLKALHLSSF